MAVYQHKNGRWYFKFQIRGKEYHRAIPEATSKREAEKAEARIKSDLLQGKYDLIENKGEFPFDELIKVYTEYAKTTKLSWKGNIATLNRFLEFFKGKQLKDISPIMIENYRSSLKKSTQKNGVTYKNATINRDIEILRKMFNIAIDNGWIDDNPCSSKKIRPLREDNKKERHLEANEEVRLLNACTDQFEYMKPIIICALQTGMRKGEILNLKWNCVDLTSRYITLIKTKSGKIRKIPINNMLLQELKSLHKSKISEFVFVNPHTEMPYVDLKGSFPALCKIADINGLTFHNLRHTAATRMVSMGVPLNIVQEILGHADIKTTMQYVHPVSKQKLEAVRYLEKFSNFSESSMDINKHVSDKNVVNN